MRRARRQNQAWRWWLKAIESRIALPIGEEQSWLVFLCSQLMVIKYQEFSVTHGGVVWKAFASWEVHGD